MRNKLSNVLTLFFLILLIRNGTSRRQSRKSENPLEDWQKRALEKIQVIAREGGLPEAEWKGITKYDKDVCYTKPCLQSALEVMEATNFTVDPCRPNMWLSFVCARRVNGVDNLNQLERLTMKAQTDTLGLLKNGLPAKGKGDDYLLKEAQNYYHKCTHKADHDKEDVKDILAYMSENYGDWPMITNRDPGPKFNWLNMIADLNRIERPGFTPMIFHVVVKPNSQLLHLEIGTMSFPVTAEDYQQMLMRIQKNTGKNRPVRLDQVQGMQQSINSASYAALTPAAVEYLTIDELQNKTDTYIKKRKLNAMKVNWLEFFQRVLKGSGIEVTSESPKIAVPLKNILGVLQVFNTQFTYNNTKSVANALNSQLATVLLHESTVLLDDLNSFKCTEEFGTREQICFQRVTEIFGYSLGRTYLSVFYDKNVETPAIKNLMSHIKQGYIDAIDSYDWMEDSTKEYLKDKILSIKTFVTQPDWTKDPKKLREFYSGMNAATSNKSLFSRNFVAVSGWKVGKQRSWAWKMSHAANPKDLNFYDVEWSRFLGTVNAQYHFVLNEVRVEGGIVHAPVFSANRPGFMNFGGLGMVLGHEIGHSFDENGRTFNKEGVEGEYWDDKSLARYNTWVANVLKDIGSETHQISETSAETTSNPRQTLNENISDILGVYISYNSYQEYLQQLEKEGKKEKILPGLKSFTPQKLFFMKYANMWCDKKGTQDAFNDMFGKHSPGNTRATLPLKRSRQFAETFGCPLPEEYGTGE